MPLNRRFPLATVLSAIDAYRQHVNRRLTFEYCLLAVANMRDDQAEALGRLARRYAAHINLIPVNPVPGSPHRAPSTIQVHRFAQLVEQAGGHLTIRSERGFGIAAACGQLAAQARQPGL